MSTEPNPFSASATPAAPAGALQGERSLRRLLGRPRRNRHVDLFVLPRVGGPSLTPGAYAGLAR
jgi:hypothetical protein